MNINRKRICLGTAQFGLNSYSNYFKKRIEIKEIKKILNYSKKKGIEYIDTALNYKGVSDRINKTKLNLNNFKIITKIPKPKNKEKNYLNKINYLIEKDLEKLKIKKYYAILLHDCKSLTKRQIHLIDKTKKLLIKKKYTKYFGLSIYDQNEYFSLSKIIKPRIVQLPFSVVDCSEKKIKFIKYLRKKKIKVQARSIFLQGILINELPKKMRKDKKILKFKFNYEKFCKNNNISKLNLSLNYVMNKKYFESILIGILSFPQLKKILNVKNNNTIKVKFNLPKNFLRIDLWKKK